MKKIYIYIFILTLFINGCNASIKTLTKEQFREHFFSIDSIDEYGIALMPIAGPNKTFNSVAQISANDVLQSYKIENYVGHRELSNQLNSQNLVKEFQEMIYNYQYSGVADNSVLKKIGEAIETRYLLNIQIGSLIRGSDTEIELFDDNISTWEVKNVRVYGLLWDTSNGNVVWEGISASLAEEGPFTNIKKIDNEIFQVATAELIHQLLTSDS